MVSCGRRRHAGSRHTLGCYDFAGLAPVASLWLGRTDPQVRTPNPKDQTFTMFYSRRMLIFSVAFRL